MATPLTRAEWLDECAKLAKTYEDAMTDEAKALVERLLWVSEWYFVDPVDGAAYASDDPLDAADRIEELEARYEKSQDQIDRLIAENERIRERLGWICAVMDLDDAVSLQWVYTELEALRGLGEKQ